MAEGSVVITSWGGKPTSNPSPAPFKMAWGTALDLLPGSEADPESRVQPQPLRITAEDALEALRWLQFFTGVADWLGNN